MSVRMHRLPILLAIVLGFAARAATAEPRLLWDVDQGGVAPGLAVSGGPEGFLALPSTVLFVIHRSDPPVHELWATDGTGAGTSLVARFATRPREMARAGDVAVFLAGARGQQERLWRSDGTRAGTVPITGVVGGDEQPAASLGGVALLTLWDGAHLRRCTLWRSDGTGRGTYALAPIYPSLGYAAQLGDAVVFIGYDRHGAALWRSDGTVAGTRRLRFLGDDQIHDLLVTTSRVFFMAGEPGDEVWTSDGTGGGTRMLGRFDGCNKYGGCSTRPLGATARSVYLADSQHLWRVDARNGDAVPVGDPPVGPSIMVGSRFLLVVSGARGRTLAAIGEDDAAPRPLTSCADGCPAAGRASFVQGPAGRALLLVADDSGRVDLWVSDATGPGTRRLASGIVQLDTVSSSDDYFTANAVQLGARTLLRVSHAGELTLWSTDGTAEGTVRLADLSGGSLEDSYYYVPAFAVAQRDGRAYLAAYDPEAGVQPWSTDGTLGGTGRIAVVDIHPPSSDPRAFAAFAGGFAFRACDGERTGIWSSDGRNVAPSLLRAEHDGCGRRRDDAAILGAGGRLYWTEPDAAMEPGVRQLWTSDGTASGALPLTTFTDRQTGSPFAWGDGVGFAVLPLLAGRAELWRTDGTVAGTRPVLELPADLADPVVMAALEDDVFFAARGSDGVRYYRTDGTLEGTVPITEHGPWIMPSNYEGAPLQPPRFARLGDKVVFQMCDGEGEFPNRCGIWVTGGTAESTALLIEDGKLGGNGAALLGGWLYAFDYDSFVRSDGTAAGTEVVANVPPPLFADPLLTVVGDRLYFVGGDEELDDELWTSDGTAAGTRLVADLTPGDQSSEPDSLLAWNGRLWWTASRPDVGRELWTLQPGGAPELAGDLAPGPLSSSPSELTAVGRWLVGSVDDRAHGREPWVLDSLP